MRSRRTMKDEDRSTVAVPDRLVAARGRQKRLWRVVCRNIHLEYAHTCNAAIWHERVVVDRPTRFFAACFFSLPCKYERIIVVEIRLPSANNPTFIMGNILVTITPDEPCFGACIAELGPWMAREAQWERTIPFTLKLSISLNNSLSNTSSDTPTFIESSTRSVSVEKESQSACRAL